MRRPASRNDVAKLANVAPSTVSHVVNNSKYVSEDLRSRVIEAIEALNYEPNLLAKSLRKQQTKQVVVFVDDLYNPYYADICKGLIKEAKNYGYIVSVALVHDKSYDYYNGYYLRQIDGIINFSTVFCEPKVFNKLKDRGTAMINCLPSGKDNYISVNYINAMSSFVERLVESGKKRIGIITGLPKESIKEDTRYIGLLYNLEKFGIKFDENCLISKSEKADVDESIKIEEGYIEMEELMRRAPDIDAVYCINDVLAFGANKYLSSHGKSVPKDVSICGCDNIFFSDFLDSKISTMGFDKIEFGKKCMQNLIAQIEGDNGESENTIIYAEYIDRGTV